MVKAEIRKLLGTDQLVIGSERCVKMLRSGGLSKVFLASNCTPQVKDDVTHYAQNSNVEVVELDVPNEELGVFCKKPFNIMVLGIRA